MTITKKRKLSISLDEDLVAELEAGGEPVSAQVNAALRVELERRRRARLLVEFLDRVADDVGPADEALVGRFEELLR
ncbi:MAG: type II toxin-antitoxin system CcdA family antitoxin [Acidimicrobiia bacterium]|nr:type II toxin-antitoxin system CcdA family antitoxin [Acidimicrobiia bacterium]